MISQYLGGQSVVRRLLFVVRCSINPATDNKPRTTDSPSLAKKFVNRIDDR